MTDDAFATVFVKQLLFGLVNAQLYGANHARVREGAQEAAASLAEHCAQRQVPSVLFGAVADCAVFEGRPVLGPSLSALRLLRRITERGAGGIEFAASAGTEDVLALLLVLARRGGAPGHDGANQELDAQGVSTIRFVPPYAGGGAGAAGGEGFPTYEDASTISLHQRTVDLLQSHALSVCQGRDIDIGEVGHTVDGLVDGLERDAALLHALANHPAHDEFTTTHVIRVSLLALEVGRAMHHDADSLRGLGTAALLHDIGKVTVPWEILHKEGPLSKDEWEVMRLHPNRGARILLDNRQSDDLAVAAAYGHHCTCDDKAYPWSCGEHRSKIVTKVVKICDCYEALTADRPYKKAMTPGRAYRTMRGMAAKGHFDPKLLHFFIRTNGVYPLGTNVRLDDGALARVVRRTGDFYRPVVRLLERGGLELPAEERREIDLTAPEPGDPTGIAESIPQASPAQLVA